MLEGTVAFQGCTLLEMKMGLSRNPGRKKAKHVSLRESGYRDSLQTISRMSRILLKFYLICPFSVNVPSSYERPIAFN